MLVAAIMKVFAPLPGNTANEELWSAVKVYLLYQIRLPLWRNNSKEQPCFGN